MPWLSRLPAALFAIPVGLFGLAAAWRRAGGYGWWFAEPVGTTLAWTAAAMLALLVALYAAKCLRHPGVIAAEFANAVTGSLMALIPLALMLATVCFGVPGDGAWLALVLFALTLQGIVAIRVVSILATGTLPAAAVTPALYLPPAAGGFVGAMALSTLGYPGWAALLFGMGLASWALLEVRVLNRLFEGPMPEALRPTIGVELAPPAVATLAAGTIWPMLPGEVLIVGLGVAAGPIVAVMARYKWWHNVPFSIGFWSFSFPLAALAGAVVEVVRRGGWPPLVGGIALAVASTVIAILAVRTLALLVRGKLVPVALAVAVSLAVATAAFVSAPGVAVAQSAGWTPMGPSAGAIRALTQDPTGGVLYAGTYAGGIFRSTDAGASWTAVAPEIRGQTVNALAVDPSAPRTVFAGTFSSGVWRSNDGGTAWKRVLFGGKDLPDRHASINAIDIHPVNPRIVYAATDAGFNAGVWRSADGGGTWALSTAGLPQNFRLNALALDPRTPATLYVGTNGDGVHKSVDSGRTWTATGEALRKEIVLSLAVDPAAPETVYAGTAGAGTFKSADGGANWTPPAAGPIRNARVFALAIDPSNPAIVWAGIANGLLRSADGGRSWTDTMPGLNYASVRALALDRAQPSTVLAGTTRDGVLRSADGGRSWAGPGAGFRALDVSGIATDRSAPQTVWLSTGTGVWRTTDGGATWGLKSEALSNRSAQCIGFEPASRTLYACTGDGVFRSTDGGEKWARHHSGLSRDTRIIGLAIDAANPKTLHARDAHWVYVSADGGVTWTKSAADLESSGSINGLFALAAVPAGVSSAQTAVFASVHRQFWRSTDGAATFGKSGSGLPLARVQTVASDADGRTVWVGTEGEGVWRSVDGGATWTESRAGMGAVNVQALLTDPATPGTLYAAAWSKGVYRSGDGGRTWNLVGGPPPHPDVIALALDPSAPGRLLVGTGGGSAWRLETR